MEELELEMEKGSRINYTRRFLQILLFIDDTIS